MPRSWILKSFKSRRNITAEFSTTMTPSVLLSMVGTPILGSAAEFLISSNAKRDRILQEIAKSGVKSDLAKKMAAVMSGGLQAAIEVSLGNVYHFFKYYRQRLGC